MNATRGTCRICGCTDADCRQCIQRTGLPCEWADKTHTLCTACGRGVNAADCKALYQRGLFAAQASLDIEAALKLHPLETFPRLNRWNQRVALEDLEAANTAAHAAEARLKFKPLKP
jgi:hypothetical protein